MPELFTQSKIDGITKYTSILNPAVSISTNNFNSLVEIEVTIVNVPTKSLYKSISKSKPLDEELTRLCNLGVDLLVKYI